MMDSDAKFHVVAADIWVYFFSDQTTVAGNTAWVHSAAAATPSSAAIYSPNYKAVATTWKLGVAGRHFIFVDKMNVILW